MVDFEQQWAVALKKAKQQKGLTVDLDKQKDQIAEELAYYKDKLKQDLYYKNDEEVKRDVATLFGIRAKQAVLAIQLAEKNELMLSDTTIKKIIGNYYKDCLRLSTIIK